MKFGDPLLDTSFEELQIDQQATSLLDLLDTFLPAAWTSLAFDVDDSVGMSLRPFQPSMPLVDDPQLTVCSHKNLLTLVIKVSTFDDVLEIFQGVFLRPKQFPTWSFLNHLLGANGRGQTLRNCRGSGVG